MSDNDSKTDPGQSAPPPPLRSVPRPAGTGGRRAARLLLGISVMGVLALGAGAVGAFIFMKDELSPDVTDGSYLEVKVDGALSDSPGADGFVLDPKQFPVLLTEMTAEIRRAATDDRITGLYVEMEGVSLGWAGAQELRGAIADFGASGKPCVAWADGYDNKSYYVASACKEIYVSPAGVMLVNGFAVTNEYYAGVFEKLGVVGNFEHVGDFKSAIEPYQRTEPSEAASAAMDTMLDGLFGEMVSGIATSRGLTPEVVQGLIDDPPITPASALERGMITGLKFRDEVAEGMAGEERTKLRDYREPVLPFATGKSIAVIHAEGAIISGESGGTIFGGSMVGDRSFIELVDDAREDEDVAAVVVRVNSPGGSGLASDNMWHALMRLKEAGKPLVVSMGDYAASGGYYIAAPADWIVAQPSTLTGSIGVFGGKMNLGGLYEKAGITTHTWRRGAMSEIFSPIANFDDPQRAKFREFLQAFYDIFLGRVSEGRKLPREAVHEVAQGRVWTGAQAKERGLVDELGGLDAAVAKARELAAVPEEESVRLVRFPKQRTFFDQLAEDMAETRMPIEASVPAVRQAYEDLYVLDRVLADGGVAAMLPGRLEIR